MSEFSLNGINIFSNLSDEECETLKHLCKPETVKNSMIILEESTVI